MTPDVWADFNQLDHDGYVVAYLEDIVRAEHVVLGSTVVVADPEAKAHTAVVAGISQEGVLALYVDWASRPRTAPSGSAPNARRIPATKTTGAQSQSPLPSPGGSRSSASVGSV